MQQGLALLRGALGAVTSKPCTLSEPLKSSLLCFRSSRLLLRKRNGQRGMWCSLQILLRDVVPTLSRLAASCSPSHQLSFAADTLQGLTVSAC